VDDAKNNGMVNASVGSQQGSSAQNQQAPARITKKQSSAALAHKSLRVLDSMKQANHIGLNE